MAKVIDWHWPTDRGVFKSPCVECGTLTNGRKKIIYNDKKYEILPLCKTHFYLEKEQILFMVKGRAKT